MCEEMAAAWRIVKHDTAIHAVVLRAAVSRAFSAGLDINSLYGQPHNVWNHEDPGELLSPKWQKMRETGGARCTGSLHRRGVLLRQRGRRGDLLLRRHVLRLPCQRRPGVRAGAGRVDAQDRPRRDPGNRADGQRRTKRRRHRRPDRTGVGGGRARRSVEPGARDRGHHRHRAVGDPGHGQGDLGSPRQAVPCGDGTEPDLHLGNPLAKAELAEQEHDGIQPPRRCGDGDPLRAHRDEFWNPTRRPRDRVPGPVVVLGRCRCAEPSHRRRGRTGAEVGIMLRNNPSHVAALFGALGRGTRRRQPVSR